MKASENPFRSAVTDNIGYRIPEGDLAGLAQRLIRGDGEIYSIAGPEGSGKTALLESIAKYLEEEDVPVSRWKLWMPSSLQEQRSLLKSLAHAFADRIILIDGAEGLSWWARIALKRMARRRGLRILATVHRKRGFPVLFLTRPEWLTTRALVEEIAGGAFTPELESIARNTFHSNGGNVREVFRNCYHYISISKGE